MNFLIKLVIVTTIATPSIFASQAAPKHPLRSCLKQTEPQSPEQQPPHKKMRFSSQTPLAPQPQISTIPDLVLPPPLQSWDQRLAAPQTTHITLLESADIDTHAEQSAQMLDTHKQPQADLPPEATRIRTDMPMTPDAAKMVENSAPLQAQAHGARVDRQKAQPSDAEQKETMAQKIERYKRAGWSDQECAIFTNPQKFFAYERSQIEENALYCTQQLRSVNKKIKKRLKQAQQIQQHLQKIKKANRDNPDYDELLDGLASLPIEVQNFMEKYDKLVSLRESLKDLIEKARHRLQFKKLMCTNPKCGQCKLFDLREHTGEDAQDGHEDDVTPEMIAEYERIEQRVPAEYRADFMHQIKLNHGKRRCMEYNAIINGDTPATEALCIEVAKSSKALCAKALGRFRKADKPAPNGAPQQITRRRSF